MRYDKALGYVKREYRKNMDVHSDKFLDELIGVAEILNSMGYSLEYRVTALFRNLLRDTEAKSEEILGHSSMEVLEAIQLIHKPMNCEMYKYMYKVKQNMLAHPVKLAEHIYDIRNINNKTNKDILNIIHKSEDYYLKCSQGTKFYDVIFKELLKIKDSIGY